MEEFRQILHELKKVKQEEGLNNLEDNMLFDCAVRIYNSILINKPRKAMMKDLSTKKESPLTEKQRELLENLNYRGNMNLTKEEATRIIQNYLEQRRAGMRVAR